MKAKPNYKKLYRKERSDAIKARQEREQEKVKYGKLEDKYGKMEARVRILEASCSHCAPGDCKYKQLEDKIKILEARLAVYDNANTPPSRKPPADRASRSDKSSRPQLKRGAQKGHKGTTRRHVPTEFKKHTPEKCPRCESTDLKVTSSTHRDITEIPPPPKPITTRHTIDTCSCRTCGYDGILADTTKELPTAGSYGKNAISQVALNYTERMPHRRNAKHVARSSGLQMSSGTVCNIMRRLGTNMGVPAGAILEAVRASGMVHADETSISLDGKLVWVWLFHCLATGNSLFVIRPCRGGAVPDEILGTEWDGTLVCDGWGAYGKYRVQRCWAHIIREVFHDAKRDERALRTACTLGRIYDDARSTAKKKMSEKARTVAQKLLVRRVRRLVSVYAEDPVMGKFMGKLGRALPDLFRFVLDPRIPPTNNTAERELREIVVHRKIRGSIRSEDTMEWLGNLFSCMSTWKNKGMDHAAEIARYA